MTAAREHRPVQWSNHYGKSTYAATGGRDVLFIVSDSQSNSVHAEAVPRLSPFDTLTEEEACKLEHQGIARQHQGSDLSVMLARHRLDKRHSVVGVLDGGTMTCEEIKREINSVMSATNKEGVALCYIGHGKKHTGDWCLCDGFLTFQDLADLYINHPHFCGHVFSIITDCSYSGNWVSSCMDFMDKQGVGPCGHSARQRGILIKVLASCQSTEIPNQLSFSINSAKNEKNSGMLSFSTHYKNAQIRDNQHPSGVDFTQVICKRAIGDICALTEGYTWKKWQEARRVNLITVEERGRPLWYYVLLNNDEEKMAEFKRKMASGKGASAVKISDYGRLLKKGWGDCPSNEIKDTMEKEYLPVYR